MIQLAPGMRLFICPQPLDMRKGIDSIASLIKNKLDCDPMSGAMFLFLNTSRTHVRVLVYDGQGFWLCTKRLSAGRFPYWFDKDDLAQKLVHLNSEQVMTLLRGGNPREVRGLPEWKKINY